MAIVSSDFKILFYGFANGFNFPFNCHAQAKVIAECGGKFSCVVEEILNLINGSHYVLQMFLG